MSRVTIYIEEERTTDDVTRQTSLSFYIYSVYIDEINIQDTQPEKRQENVFFGLLILKKP